VTAVSPSRFCAEPWQKFALTVDGNIARCFSSPGGNAGSTSEESDLLKVWNGSSFREFRAAVAADVPSRSICRACPHILSATPVPFLSDKEGEDSPTEYGRNIRLQRREFESGETVLRSLPTALHIEPSAHCNLNCIMCSQMDLKRSMNDQTMVEKLVDAVIPTATYVNWSGGEPLVQPAFKHFMRSHDFRRNPFLGLTIMTNGTLIDTHHLDFLSRFKRSAVCVSIDGVGEVYESIRVGARWGGIESVMSRLLRARDARSHFGVSAAFTIQKRNVANISDYLSWCREMCLPTVFMAVFSVPIAQRPDVFSVCERETVGWRESLATAVAAAEALDDAVAGYLHPFGEAPIRSAPYVSTYVDRILRAMDKAERWPVRRFRPDISSSEERPSFLVFRDAAGNAAYAELDQSGTVEVGLPDGEHVISGFVSPSSFRRVFHGRVEIS